MPTSLPSVTSSYPSSSSSGFKTIKDFADLSAGHNLFYKLTLAHFKAGLDPSIILSTPSSKSNDWLRVSKSEYQSGFDGPFENHILYLLIYQSNSMGTPKSEQEEIKAYFKEHFLRLYKEGHISQALVDNTAFLLIDSQFDPSILEFLISSSMLSINTRDRLGQTLLMMVEDKSRIDMLLNNGADINAKVSLASSADYGKTAYELAIKNNKKGWMKYLQPHLDKSVIDTYGQELLNSFKAEANFKKQIKIFIKSLKDSSNAVIDEITNNQAKYKDVIEYKDGHKKDLLRYCISNNSKEVALKVMALDYYQKNKKLIMNPAAFLGDCYCSYALGLAKPGMAKLLFEQDFKVQKELIKFFASPRYTPPCPTVFNLLLDSGYSPNLEEYWKNESSHKIEEKLKDFSAPDISNFIATFPHMLSLANTRLYNNEKNIYASSSGSNYVEVKSVHVRFFCKVLKAQQQASPLEFEANFKTFLISLDKSEDKICEYFTLLTLSEFPKEKNKILSYLSQGKPFVVKLIKQDLEAVLEKFEAKEVKKFKI